MNRPGDDNQCAGGAGCVEGAAQVLRRGWPGGLDLLVANMLAIFVPFAMFRYVMLKAFQTFNLRKSSAVCSDRIRQRG
jgi:hypothetical protein